MFVRGKADREAPVPAAALAAAVLVLLGWTLAAPGGAWGQQESPPAQQEEAAGRQEGSGGRQTPPGPQAQGPQAQGQEGEDLSFDSSLGEEDFEAIDTLLREDEAVRSGPEATGYDPGTRRDPFRSLIVQRERPQETEVERPDGVPGLLIDELEIQGVFELPEGPVAQVMSASHETSYLLRPGDELWDGDVVSITLEEVVFKQVVTDTTALKPFQLVVKRLNP